MIDRKLLLSDLQKQVKNLEKDLREQADSVEEVRLRLRGEYDHAFKVGRTAATWTAWRDERVTQAAVAWVLGTVFVRFCEDNGLLPDPYLAGPGDRLVLAEEAEAQFFRDQPDKTLRDWLHQGYDAIAGTQAGKSLFDKRHNPLYQIPLSHDEAKYLIGFWRRRGEAGGLVHDFADPEWDTRFLGDLYQDLSEAARKTYALLQTPEFVEEFILDLTLTPAIDEFGHDVVKMIDPTCGSGHFVLGAFHRLLKKWEQHAPNRDPHERVRLALEAVHGVDINPFAVAIARFRLLVAALRASGVKALADSAGYVFPMHLAVGDSLIKRRQAMLFGEDPMTEFAYSTEDVQEHSGVLSPGRYHVVVGNPPYITVKDKGLNEAYREMYDACAGKYALSVPFAQRFFQLAKPGDEDGKGAGHVGQITANSFMKREFGKKMIEVLFATRVNLSHVIDASGAYIPGHGTPTVIVVGRNTNLNRPGVIRTVMGIRGEPSAPVDPKNGIVWRAIMSQIGRPGSESEWISVSDIPRPRLSAFPWNLSGGGAGNVVELVENARAARLGGLVSRIGCYGIIGADEVMRLGIQVFRRSKAECAYIRRLVVGDEVRDWGVDEGDFAFHPYRYDRSLVVLSSAPLHAKRMWSYRTELGNRATFTRGTYFGDNRPWFEWHQIPRDEGTHSNSIAFAFVATHAQFVLSRSEMAFGRTAPIIKLPAKASENDHLRLLGLINSSTACFWLKQVSHNKGNEGYQSGIKTEMWERFYEFTGTKLQEFPLPSAYPLELSRKIDGLAQRLATVSPAAVAASDVPTRERLAAARDEWHAIRARMIALQEELDWQVYSLYGLLDEDLTAPANSVPELKLGERAFEIVLARKMAAGEAETQWFARHGSTPITELPAHWSDEYRSIVERRIAVIEGNRNIGLIERPECKRRWAGEGWDAMQAKALRDWLLDRCEARELWYQHVDDLEQPRPLTTAQLADELRRDADVLTVANLYAPGQDLGKVIAGLVADEHVPHLAALRYKDTGLAKRADWEQVWGLQRQEDALPDEAAKREFRKGIPVPPKYTSADFLKSSFWKHRGKLDVPKERFVSYPGASRDGDPSLLVGWAGWDHREQAQALATLIVAREQEDGWADDRLLPLVAGLREILPWVRQWHGEFDPEWGASPADIYDGFLAETTNRLHLTEVALASWRPAKATRGRKAKV
ncbi:BREX-2 system adenine-specific DNA-methyltransferase PglX [Micromonospora acroterricola]|uniref:site-specific DNA-methyltransferase (adenine-specific) n=1 Tax=Micromonospora acroterricola TaxID=2202421 RepID=A0A317DB88_9ACTN|nr:BREX-2 system adenine-specific DNA-methyltransferase PglX [Micromonospora acroterricola]PWR09925.1 BREX-2 system adenine-specific DNA-methyltransferase PglX [Micromonospora acroterricola]